jgi:hypothetical protein
MLSRSTPGVVFFDVLVRDKRTGLPVKDLTSDNFQVLDGLVRELLRDSCTQYARFGACPNNNLCS